jgi:hypothetical protein
MSIKWGGGTSQLWRPTNTQPIYTAPTPVRLPVKPPTTQPVPLARPVFNYDAAPPARSFGLSPNAPALPAGIPWGLLLVAAVGLYFAVKK